MSVTLCMLLTHGLTVLRTRYADARLRPRSAPGPPRSSAPLRDRAISRRVREDVVSYANATAIRCFNTCPAPRILAWFVGLRLPGTAASSSLQTSIRTAAESERVFSKLQRTLTSIRSTMTENRLEAIHLLACYNSTASTVIRQTTCSVHLLRNAGESTSFRIADIAKVVGTIDTSAAYRPSSSY